MFAEGLERLMWRGGKGAMLQDLAETKVLVLFRSPIMTEAHVKWHLPDGVLSGRLLSNPDRHSMFLRYVVPEEVLGTVVGMDFQEVERSPWER